MKKLLICLLFLSVNFYAQTKEKVLEEGYKLYRSEKASWHGTDVFLEKHGDKRDQIKGYFSTQTTTNTTVFFMMISPVQMW